MKTVHTEDQKTKSEPDGFEELTSRRRLGGTHKMGSYSDDGTADSAKNGEEKTVDGSWGRDQERDDETKPWDGREEDEDVAEDDEDEEMEDFDMMDAGQHDWTQLEALQRRLEGTETMEDAELLDRERSDTRAEDTVPSAGPSTLELQGSSGDEDLEEVVPHAPAEEDTSITGQDAQKVTARDRCECCRAGPLPRRTASPAERRRD
jgi:hypothetical protein